MPWNGAGVYSPPVGSFPENNGTIIDAVRFDATINDLAAGITASLAKNGENIPTANLPMGGFKHTNAGDGAAAGQYLAYAQATNAYINGNFGVGAAPVTRLGVLTNNVGAAPAAWNAGYVTIGPNANNPSGANLGFGYDTTNDIANIMALAPSVAWKKLQLNSNSLDLNCASGNLAMRITSTGVIQDASGNELGFKDLSFASAKVAPYTVVAADRGIVIVMNTPSNVTVPTGLPQFGIVVIYNNSGVPLTIVQGGGVTLRLEGTTSTGNRTLAGNGKAVLWFFSPPVYSISGTGLS